MDTITQEAEAEVLKTLINLEIIFNVMMRKMVVGTEA